MRLLILRFCNFHRWRLVKDADDPRGDDESAIMREILDDDEAGMTMDQKKLRLQSSMRMLKDEPVPEGYMRFR